MLDNFISGFGIIFHWEHILAIVVGSSLGLVVGAIPGLTATMAVALILPMTFYDNPALVLQYRGA